VWSNWKNLRLNRKGLIADTPAVGFQFRYAVDLTRDWWECDPPLGQAHYKVEIKAGDGTLLFQQQVSFRYVYVTLVSGPLLLIFTWWLDTNNAKIETTVPSPVFTLGDEKPYYESDNFGDVIAGQAHMMFTLYSGVYMVPLPAGSTFDMREMNIGFGLLDADGLIQTRVLQGGELTGVRLMQDGMVRLIQPHQGGGLEFLGACDVRAMGAQPDSASAWPYSGSEAPTRAQVESIVTSAGGVTTGLLFYLHEVTPVVLYQEGAKLRAVRSLDDGLTWRDLMEIANGVTMVAADVGPDGGTIYIVGMRGQQAVGLVCSFERDAAGQTILRATDEFPAVGLSGLPTSLQMLKIQNGVFHLVVSEGGGIRYWQSVDGMRSWE